MLCYGSLLLFTLNESKTRKNGEKKGIGNSQNSRVTRGYTSSMKSCTSSKNWVGLYVSIILTPIFLIFSKLSLV